MAINIGDNNKIDNSNIIDREDNKVESKLKNKSFLSRHIILTGVIGSLIASGIWFILTELINR